VVTPLSPWKGERRGVGALSVDLVNGVATSPLTPARSLREREQPSCVSLKLSVTIRPAVSVGFVSFPLTLALSRREREQCVPRCDEARRSGLANARREILPLPKGEGRGEGEAPLETPMRLRTVDELN